MSMQHRIIVDIWNACNAGILLLLPHRTNFRFALLAEFSSNRSEYSGVGRVELLTVVLLNGFNIYISVLSVLVKSKTHLRKEF